MYLIKNKNDNSYWKHDFGWIGEDYNATLFTKEEYETLNLPMEGEWIKLKRSSNES